jgi:chromosome segregation ATPase
MGDQETLDTYEKLKLRQASIDEMMGRLSTKRDTLETLQREYADTEEVRRAFKNRASVKKELELNELQIRYLECSRLKRDAINMNKNSAALHSELAVAQSYVELSEKYLETYNDERATLQEEVKACNVIREHCNQFMVNPPAARHEQAVEDLDKKLNASALRRTKKDKQMAQDKVVIEQLKGELVAMHKDETIAAERRKLLGNKIMAAEAVNSARSKVGEIQSDLDGVKRRINQSEAERQSLKSTDEMKLNTLKMQNKDAFDGMNWLKENRKQFKKTVHNPIMTTLSLSQLDDAVYVQKLAGKQDLEAFVCEDSQDANKLMRALRDGKKLRKINVVCSPATSIPHPTQELRHIPGFVSFVSDTFKAPLAVKSHLVKSKGLNKVPIFQEGSQPVAIEKSGITRYFVGKKFYIVKRFRYGNGGTTSMEDLRHDRCSHTTFVSDEDEIARLDADFARYSYQAREVEARMVAAVAELKKVEAEVAKFDSNLEAVTQMRENRQNKEQKLRDKIRDYDQLESSADEQVCKIKYFG